MFTFRKFNPYDGIDKAEFMRDLAAKLCIRVFVETGTADGNTTWHMKDHFDYVVSIEADVIRAEGVTKRLSEFSNVEIVVGSSEKLLPEMCVHDVLAEPCLFYLDAHGSPELHLPPGTSWCPLVEEVSAIARRAFPDMIVIDDARLLGEDRWPSEAQIRSILGDRYEVILHCDTVVCLHKSHLGKMRE